MKLNQQHARPLHIGSIEHHRRARIFVLDAVEADIFVYAANGKRLFHTLTVFRNQNFFANRPVAPVGKVLHFLHKPAADHYFVRR